jgi:glucose-6-phosphate isomerase
MSTAPETTAAWRSLATHHDDIGGQHLRRLFADDPGRGERFVLEVGDLVSSRGGGIAVIAS